MCMEYGECKNIIKRIKKYLDFYFIMYYFCRKLYDFVI